MWFPLLPPLEVEVRRAPSSDFFSLPSDFHE
jgi:hypothetical protein